MYFPVGWPKRLTLTKEDDEILESVVANRERCYFAVLSSHALSIWNCKPAVKIVQYRRASDSVIVIGRSRLVEWKPDSAMLAVATGGGYLLFFKLQQLQSEHLYRQKCTRTWNGHHFNDYGNSVPSLKLTLIYTFQIHGGIKSMTCIKEDLMISTGNGLLQRVRWDGVDIGQHSVIPITTIPFSVDLQQSRETLLEEPGLCLTQIKYSPIIGGFAVVLADGRGAFLTSASAKFELNKVHGVWAPDLNTANCVAINHKYRLIVFGCNNGQGIVYVIDEITGSLLANHRLILSSKDYPDACAAGVVSGMKWTPDGRALLMSWSKGGFSLWSVFGAKLLCTLGGDYGISPDAFKSVIHVRAMDWGIGGYHLWMTAWSQGSVEEEEGQEIAVNNPLFGELLQLQFVKSALTINPCMSNHEHLFLQGEDKLYINTGDTILRSATANVPSKQARHTNSPSHSPQSKAGDYNQSPSILIGNKQWQVIQIPHVYLNSNWPLRYASIDRTGQCVAVAGKTGLAHYAMFTRKWKLFGNESQEKDLVVSGGMTWWKDFIVLSCLNLFDQRDEIRFYPRSTNLDNVFACICRVPYPVLLINTFQDTLIIFCADFHVSLYTIERKENNSNPVASVKRLQDISLANFVLHPVSVISVTLTSLRSDTVTSLKSTSGSSKKQASNAKEVESLLVNVAGRLLMLQRDRSSNVVKIQDGRSRKGKELPFCAPVVLASSVENVWATSRTNRDKPHLMEALWLGCGAAGIKCWLPLFPHKEDTPHDFLAKRIMLPFHMDIYPLAVLFEDAVILGAANDVVIYEPLTPDPVHHCPPEILPFMTLERTTQIYLHHVLRQLLRRNLGFHALEIARSCISLPYFPHVLELMLHQVLEREATASDPIPDALLPRVVAFIHEFPEHLQTISHCARKTEIALWPYLFSTVGDPKDLFEECLKIGALETAASYLIILQNMELPKVSKHFATQLLETSLIESRWQLCKDLIRFLRAIGPVDPDSTPRTPAPITAPGMYPLPPTPQSLPSQPSSQGPSPPITPTENAPNFAFGSPAQRARTFSSVSSASSTVNPTDKRLQMKRQESNSNLEEFYMDLILNRHARKLLGSYRLRDLGLFAAHLNFSLIQWLKKEKSRAAKLEDFEKALKKLHLDFNWPFPNYNVVLSSMSNTAKTSTSQELPVIHGNQINGDERTNPTLSLVSNPSSNNPSLATKRGQLQLQSYITASGTHVSSDEVKLQMPPRANSTEDGSLSTPATTEENSSTLGEVDGSLDDNLWASANSQELAELELLTKDLAQRGPPQAEAELRYLLKQFLDASCLEWALVIATVLMDTSVLADIVSRASGEGQEVPLDVVGRMREGLSFLELWADTECMGYKPFLLAIKPQQDLLSQIATIAAAEAAAAAVATAKTTASTSSDVTTTNNLATRQNSGGHLFFHESMKSEDQQLSIVGGSQKKVEQKPEDEDDGYDCLLS